MATLIRLSRFLLCPLIILQENGFTRYVEIINSSADKSPGIRNWI